MSTPPTSARQERKSLTLPPRLLRYNYPRTDDTMNFDLLALRCSGCSAVLDDSRALVNHGDMVFHPACAPACDVCGRRLAPQDVAWRCEAEVVSRPWGYALQPVRFWCARCSGEWRTRGEG